MTQGGDEGMWLGWEVMRKGRVWKGSGGEGAEAKKGSGDERGC